MPTELKDLLERCFNNDFEAMMEFAKLIEEPLRLMSMDYFEKECYIKEIFPPIPINDDQVNNYIDLEGGAK
jgi:hypothetical protein